MSHPANDRGHWESRNAPVFNAPGAVVASIAVLVAIHAGLSLAGEDWQVWALYAFAVIPARFGAAFYPMIAGSEYWSLLTYAFLHADWMHLMFNSLWLLVFGTPVARFLGGSGFLVLCAIAAVSGGLASLALHWGEPIIMIGASGSVSGLLGAAIPIMYGRRVPGGARPLLPRELLTSGKALGFMAIWLAITLVSGTSGWTGNGFMAEGGIAWEAHIGGFIGGIAAFYLIWRARVHAV